MPNPWIIVGFLVALILVGWGAYEKGDTDGSRRTELTWQTREAQINADAAVKTAAADKHAQDVQTAHELQTSAIATHYEGQLLEKDHALSDARATARAAGMFAHAAGCTPAAGNPAGAVSTGAGGRDGPALCRLSDDDANFLLGEASRADKVVAQLTAAQAELLNDRVACH